MTPPRFTLDLSGLPSYGFGARSLGWWGVVCYMLIEGTGFALAFGAYGFLMGGESQWPSSAPAPDLFWGTLCLGVLLVSEIPNVWIKRLAEKENLKAVRIGLVVMSLFGLAAIGARWFEFTSLNIGWARNAYGSIVWALLLLHTTHLLTDWADTLVLTCLVFTRHGVEGRSFVDTSENALYWHFIVGSWVIVYVIIYWIPRWS